MAELQKRRPLRMQGYDYSEQGLYFLTVCVKNKEKILCDIVGGGVLDVPRPKLTAVGKIVDKYIKSINNTQNVSIEKYVIMPDHIHLLVFVENEGYYGTSRTPSLQIMLYQKQFPDSKGFVIRRLEKISGSEDITTT